MVKRFLVVIIIVLCAVNVNASAQNKNLSGFVNLVRQGSQIHFSFSQSNFNQPPITGNVIVKGKCYRMEVDNGIMVVNNGATEWYINADRTEIVIYNSNMESADITKNPFAFLDAAQNLYTISASGQVKENIPRNITLQAKNGVKYNIEVLSFGVLDGDKSDNWDKFNVNIDLYPDAVVTDLR